ncbi:MAG: peptidoglycan-binding protein LysM [Woeseia sp.]|nr:peptidoglycan-binding protein LysM [Woeseia sp.]MBT8097582.1 peptidoglycan-binding protein LysM [Woeseia sp.]NNE61415.1 peptidoglycan-binding protein LysM [Woeseia sp.]NNL53897.1 peptidoglycan-binding protein LysM [Woeseia sp.]
MGLFDFAKDVGRQLFDTDNEAADNIKQHLEIKMTGLKDLTVEFDDGVATLCGSCTNQQTREQAILIAGNVKGVEKVVADKLVAPAAAAPKAAATAAAAEPATQDEFYEIKSGDTLGKIAKQFYGSASKYMKIFEANRDIIDNPDRIYPGQKIRIPK